MSDVAVRAENLSKLYRIGERDRYFTLRDTIMNFVRRPLARFSDNDNGVSSSSLAESTIWALKDVSFEVKRGEVVGIIGRNGAGKSTLLKILSRITVPTEGEARIYGRVGSLLEVGTGFHPELTGRENIYLNGAILGMKSREIDRKFDEIVNFAEVEKFLDTPVKHYSSGMQMRLAFSVAAHLEPEILLVDEVLAVGDAAFQKKCLGKMRRIDQNGRTVFFVSHNLQAVRSLCKKCLLLRAGRAVFFGDTESCVLRYLNELPGADGSAMETVDSPRPKDVQGLGASLRFTKVTLGSNDGPAIVRAGEPLSLAMEVMCNEELHDVVFGVGIVSLDGVRLVQYRSNDAIGFIPALKPGYYSLTCKIDNLFAPGRYTLELGARCDQKGLDWLPESLCFEIVDARPYESLWLEARTGYLNAVAEWDSPRPLGKEMGS